ncbi:nucleotidyltransferase domain-containing protein [Danxiaibacter flavus]|uniref:Nucleotidyltransferase domain-containing protein n=1 Tax=Danxiaibacter flavus TaxID=3049108 RepID=A0ABV3ZKC8_9BACT|nr:nucleotidyltransferase domain-containing protein [Chitinophagaceae bacterium DXS]
MTINDLKTDDLILLECVSGSRAYGLATEKSDTDIKGVYYLPKNKFYGTTYIPQVSNKTNDVVYYELGRFIELLQKNNPNILELLSSPKDCILQQHPMMNKIKQEIFLSKMCKETFGGYAVAQIKKARGLKKKIVNPVELERKSVLDFCHVLAGNGSMPLKEWLKEQNISQENCGLVNIAHTKGVYALYYDKKFSHKYRGIVSSEMANEVCLSSVPKGEEVKTHLFFNAEAYSIYCKDYKEYWDWVGKRNDERYLTNQKHGKPYDAKNMMHTIRLLQMAEEIALYKTIHVRRQNRDELLAIKAGDFDYEDLLSMANDLMQKIEDAFKTSALPDQPDTNLAEQLLVNMREILYN